MDLFRDPRLDLQIYPVRMPLTLVGGNYREVPVLTGFIFTTPAARSFVVRLIDENADEKPIGQPLPGNY